MNSVKLKLKELFSDRGQDQVVRAWASVWLGCVRVSGHANRLVGLVVKASASRAEDPGFESHLRRAFWGVESYQ